MLTQENASITPEQFRQRVSKEIGKIIIGQKEVIDDILIAMAAGGHVLLEGVPGLAKTLMISTLSKTLSLQFSRIQFTPDLMPADIIGTEVLEHGEDGKKSFRFIHGPIFSNIILADEINRTPPKTQSALLQAMEEKYITVGRNSYGLNQPYFVLATQNPIELSGTYPLPEAQLDRFMMYLKVNYPSFEEETEIARSTTGTVAPEILPVLSAEEMLQIQKTIRGIEIPDSILKYAVQLIRKTRPEEKNAPDRIKKYVTWGAGPRALQHLILTAKARAALFGQSYAAIEDLHALAPNILRHRILFNYQAETDGFGLHEMLQDLKEDIKKRR